MLMPITIFNSTRVVYIKIILNVSIVTRLQIFSNYYAYMEGISYLDSLIFEISVEFSMHESILKCLLSFILNSSLSWKYKIQFSTLSKLRNICICVFMSSPILKGIKISLNN